jgi:transposase-like protein
MAGKRHSPSQIARKLREAEEMISGGATVGQTCQELGISEQTFYRWRSQFGQAAAKPPRPSKPTEPAPPTEPAGVDRLAQLESENHRLRNLIVDMALKIQSLKKGGGRCDCDP